MPSVTSYTKAQIDALIAGAGGGGPKGQIDRSVFSATVRTPNISSEGGIDDASIAWGAEVVKAGTGGFTSLGSGYIVMSPAWYQVELWYQFIWAIGTTGLTYCRAALNIAGDYASNVEDYSAPVVDSAGYVVVSKLLNVGPVYITGSSPGLRPSIRWNPNKPAPDAANFLAATITKLT